jgi:predicted Zn-dependent protease
VTQVAGPRTGADEAVETADRVLAIVRRHAADAEAEVTVHTGTAALTRFATSFIHQNMAEEMSHISLRVAVDGRVSGATLDGPATDAAVARLVTGALEAARTRPVDPDWPGVAPAAAPPQVDHWDDGTAAASPDERAERVAAFVAAAGGLETAGSCATDASSIAFANSAGQRVSGRSTSIELDGIARTPTSDGSARSASTSISAIDGTDVGTRAAAKARAAMDPTDLDAGHYEVVLEPQCVANVVRFLSLYGFNARAVEEGRSFVRIGEQQFDASIGIRDDVTDPAQTGVAFDAEGTPKRRVDVVVDGRTTGVFHTRRTARSANVESTGHAIEGATAFGAAPSNVVVEPGSAPSETIIAGVERGLLVTDFWYTRVLDPRTLVVTGLTRNGVWLVEDGRIVRPVRNLRFTQSYVDALAPGAVRVVSSDRALIPDEYFGAHVVPTLHLASWNFTGNARG